MIKKKLTLWLYPPHEMALLKDKDKWLHFGNYWDFHAGCHGTVKTFADGTIIDFKNEWNDYIKGPSAVAAMIAKKINATVVVKIRKTPFE